MDPVETWLLGLLMGVAMTLYAVKRNFEGRIQAKKKKQETQDAEMLTLLRWANNLIGYIGAASGLSLILLFWMVVIG